MAYRKRKHQETPFRSKGQDDPTATWRSNIPPNKSFHFSRRTKTKTDHPDKKAAAPLLDSCKTGLRRFQRRNSFKAKSHTKLDDTDLEEGEPLLGKKAISKLDTTSNAESLFDFERIIPLGNSDGNSKTSNLATKHKKNKKKKIFLGVAQNSLSRAVAKKAVANHFKTSFHGSHTTKTKDCDSSLGATSTLSSPQALRRPGDPSDGGGKRKSGAPTTPPSGTNKKTISSIMDLPQVISVVNPSSDKIDPRGLPLEQPIENVAQEPTPKALENKITAAPVATSVLAEANQEKPQQREATPSIFLKATVETQQNNPVLAEKASVVQHLNRTTQPMPIVENPPLDSSVGRESHTTLDVTKNDKNERNDHTRLDSHEDISKEETTTRSCANQSSVLLLTKANLLAHSREEEATATNHDKLEPSIPQTSLCRSDTVATTRFMGLSPPEAFHKRANALDKDSHLGNPEAPTCKDALVPSRSDHNGSQHMFRNSRNCLDTYSSEEDTEEYLFRSPRPRRLLAKFNAVASSEVPTKAMRKNHRAVRDSNRIGKRSRKKNSPKPQRKDSRPKNRPSRHTTSVLEGVIASALGSQTIAKSTKRKVETMASNNPAKRPAVVVEHSFKAQKSAFVRRNRERTETVGNSDDLKRMLRNTRRTPFESAYRKQQVPSSAKVIHQKPKRIHCGNNNEDFSDWSVDFDNLSLSSDDASLDGVASFFEDCPTDEKELTKNKRNDSEEPVKHPKSKKQPKQPTTPPSLRAPTSASEKSKSPETSHTAVSYQLSIRLVLVLFYAYAVLWTGCSPGDSIILRRNGFISNRIDPGRFERNKRMLHHIRFSKNPNLPLLQSSKTQESAMM